jgi:hypothetical protein
LYIGWADNYIAEAHCSPLCGPIPVAGFVLSRPGCGQGPCLFIASADIDIYGRPTTTWAGLIVSFCVGYQLHSRGPLSCTVSADRSFRLGARPTSMWTGPMLVHCVGRYRHIWPAHDNIAKAYCILLCGPILVANLMIGRRECLARPIVIYWVGRYPLTVWAHLDIDGAHHPFLSRPTSISAGPILVHCLSRQGHIALADTTVDKAHGHLLCGPTVPAIRICSM